MSIRGVSLPPVRSAEVYVKLKIGPISFQTPRRPVEGPWGDTFEFRINSHAHLFYTLQVDVYEYRLVLPSVHIGRTELRIARFDTQPGLSRSSYGLRHRKNCYVQLTELRIRDALLEDVRMGDIELEVNYRPTTEAHPVVRLSTFANVSLVELQSALPSPLAGDALVRAPSPGNPNRIYDPSVATESADSRSLAQPDVVSLFKRILGYVMSNEEYFAIRNLLDLVTTWGQGVEVGSLSLFVGYVVLQRYFKTLPVPFGNHIVLRKRDLEVPIVMYRYTMATYGWRGLAFFGKSQGIIYDSLRKEADLRAVLDFLNMAKSDLLIFELGESRLFRPNFFVAIDRGLSAVILSIRGTMSLSDSITDFACEYIKYRSGMVHSGFFEAARWFMENVCHQLLIFAKEYELDNIYITGHSLGASTSSLTTMLLVDQLQKEGSWPTTPKGVPVNIHCYAFGPAPTTTRNLCADYERCIDVFIYGDDIVPRMSYGSMIDFQVLLVYTAEIARAADAFRDGIDEELVAKIHRCSMAMKLQAPQMNLKLYIPGSIHHMLKLKAPSNTRYTVIDTTTCDRFTEFNVTRRMMFHHMPVKYEKALHDAYLVLLQEEADSGAHPEDAPQHIHDAIETLLGDSPLHYSESVPSDPGHDALH